MNNINLANCIYLDTETTGLNGTYCIGGDEIVELCICDNDRNVLINTLVKPSALTEWHDAQKIHGISPEMVKDAPSLDSLMPQIREIIKDKTVVIYNALFDSVFFPYGTFDGANTWCCMLMFAHEYGEWDHYRDKYKWQKLVNAADHVEHKWTSDPHRALSDVQATISVWHWLQARHQTKTDRVTMEAKRQKQREARRVRIAAKEKIFAKSMRKRGATPDVLVKAGTPERLAVSTKSDIFKGSSQKTGKIAR